MTDFTATQKANAAARQILILAQDRGAVVTRELVDEVLTYAKKRDFMYASANRRTVLARVRRLAEAKLLPVALTDREEMLMHRAWLRYVTLDQAWAIRESMGDATEDDKPFLDAFSVTWHPRSVRTAWTKIPAALEAWGAKRAWTLVTGLASI